MTEEFANSKRRLAVILVSMAALGLITACGGDEPERAPVRTATPGVTIGDQVSLAGTRAILVGEERGQLHLDDASSDGQTMLLRISNPADGTACSKLAAATLAGEVRTMASDASVVRFDHASGHSAFSPDGSQVAYVGTSDCTNRAWGELKVVPAGGGGATTLDTFVVRLWGWTPAGAVLYTKADTPGVWSTSPGGAPAKISEETPLDVASGGQVMAFADPAGTAFQPLGGEKVAAAVVPPDASRQFLSPDGSISPGLTGDEEGRVLTFGFVRTDTGETVGEPISAEALAEQDLQPPYSVAWSPDGSLLFVQGSADPGASSPPAYALTPEGAFAGVMETGGAGLGSGLVARDNLLFFESGNEIHVAVLSEADAAGAEAQLAQLSETFPEPLAMTFGALPQ